LSFAELSARFLANGTVRPYHVNRLKHLLPYFEGTAIGRISKGAVREVPKSSGTRRTTSGRPQVNRDVAALRRLLYWAVEQNLLAGNPLTRVKMERERRVSVRS